MDAARDMMLLQYTDRRKLRIGEVNGVSAPSDKVTRRGARAETEEEPADHTPVDAFGDAPGLGHVAHDEETAPTAETQSPAGGVTRRHSNGETDAEQDARVAREKAQYQAMDAERKAGQSLLESRLQATGRMAAQVGLPGLARWQKERQAERLIDDKEAEKADYETRISASTSSLSRFLAEAGNSSNSWQYRQNILARAKDTVATHLSDLSDLHDKFYDQFHDFAGHSQLQAQVSQQMSEVEKRRKFLEEYYNALERLASNDPLVGADFRRLGNTGDVAPAMVRNSSRMRLLARRRRKSWWSVA